MATQSAVERPLVRWKDLCLDAVDVERQAQFWAVASGLDVGGEPGHRSLEGPTPRHRIWINEVDRPHVVKNRTHLDLDVEAGTGIEALVALGARVVLPAAESGFAWTAMTDPEGNEFCAFERAPADLSPYRLHGLVVDVATDDAGRLARWWARAFGTEVSNYVGEDFFSLVGALVDDEMTMDFQPVPEPRTVPNRVHWDVVALGDRDETMAELLALGATHLWDTEGWRVLADPDGNEFCVFAAG